MTITPSDKVQEVLAFFDVDDRPTREEAAVVIDTGNPECPLSRFKGNPEAMSRIIRACRAAYLNRLHRFSQSFALLGPASTGKTTLVKLIAETVGLPHCLIQPKSVKTTMDVLEKINEACNDAGVELVPEGNKITLPVMIVFIDEVHSLSKGIEQGLLTATEANDGMMDTGEWKVDCRNVCWIVATTDRGLLFDAFDTRFTKIHLEPYTQQQVAEIVQGVNKGWPMESCLKVAKYAGRIAREALAFAEEVKTELVTSSGSLDDAIETIRRDSKIDEHGLSFQRLRILTELAANGPIPAGRMPAVAGCKVEELDKFVMPLLMTSTPDQPAMVRMTPKGYDITAAGLAQLDLRGLVHGAERDVD